MVKLTLNFEENIKEIDTRLRPKESFDIIKR